MDLRKQRAEWMEQNFLGCVTNVEMLHCPTSHASELSSSLEQEENYSCVCQNGGGAKARVVHANVTIWLTEHFSSRLLRGAEDTNQICSADTRGFNLCLER